ncbi:MAG: hypothetical protein OXB86_00380 [Bdellovibrionales bacterium]|nr:hypothetical protein [Bdellovibrionales bacterium]
MNEQKHPPYDNYDLVRGKKAGVLVELGKEFKENISFTLKLYVGKKLYHSKCHHTPLIGQMTNNEFTDCTFTKTDLDRDGYYKFFPFPLFKPVKNISVWIVLMPKTYQQNRKCWKGKHSGISVIETPGLKVGFTRINGGRSCSGYNPTPLRKVRDFVDSDEVKKYLPSMLPVPRIKAEVLTTHNNKNYISGNCNNRKADPKDINSKRTIGILRDIDALERERGLKGYSKIIAVASRDYFDFHNKSGSNGFVLLPDRKGRSLFGSFNLDSKVVRGGSWNVAFVSDDTKDGGTVAHELAHTLGQGREFYKPGEICRTFKEDALKLCKDYQISRSLNARQERGEWVFNFVKNRFSIVNNKGDIGDIWIDRETYQKIFSVLAKKGAVIPEDDDLYKTNSIQKLRTKRPSLKALVSGYYRAENDSFFLPKTTIHTTRFFIPSVSSINGKKISTVTFQLRDRQDKTLQSIKRPVLKTDIEILYKNKTAKRTPFKFYHFLVALSIPESSKKRGLKAVVISPKGRVIYSAPIRIKLKQENVAFIDKLR